MQATIEARDAGKLVYPATWFHGERWNDMPAAVEKGEMRVRELSPEQKVQAEREAAGFGEFKRPSRLYPTKKADELWSTLFKAPAPRSGASDG